MWRSAFSDEQVTKIMFILLWNAPLRGGERLARALGKLGNGTQSS